MFKELLVLIAIFVFLLIVSSKIQRLGSDAIVGSYQLSNHRTITLRADGTVISNLKEEGKWLLVDIATHQYIIVWKKLSIFINYSLKIRSVQCKGLMKKVIV